MRHAALHARAEAFPLGLAVLAGKGVTAWHNVLADLVGEPSCHPLPIPIRAPAALPAGLADELIKVLAAITLVPT